MIKEIKVTGLAELQQNLKIMGELAAAKAIVASVFNAGKIIETEVKNNIIRNELVDSGALLASIIRRRKVYRNGVIYVMIGVANRYEKIDDKGVSHIPNKYAGKLEERNEFLIAALHNTQQQVIDKVKKSLQAKLRRFMSKNKSTNTL